MGRSSGWVHSVLNFIGPNNGQGISVYQDGQHKGNATTKDSTSSSDPSIGRIVIGRLLNGHYASVQVDELLFFNQTLTESEITMLNQYTG